jgi:hypothetical protein
LYILKSLQHHSFFLIMKLDLSYYTITFYFASICSLAATVVGYKHKNKFSELRFFYLYPFATFIQSFLIVAFSQFDAKQKIIDSITREGVVFFLVIEFSMIYYFFWQVIQSILIRRFLLAITFIYIIIIFYSITKVNYFYALPISLFNIQTICILIPCLFHIFELLKNLHIQNLFINPSFWITIGIVLYFYCTLPLFLMLDFAYNKNVNILNVYSINYIFYGILYLLTIKAYLCPKRDTP